MTLILTCLTEQYVLQVSDRRVGKMGRHGYVATDDDRTKMAIINDRYLFAFTGWAELGGMKTDYWFVRTMKPYVDAEDIEGGLNQVRTLLARFFSQRFPNGYPQDKRHAFVGACWVRRQRDGRVYPRAVLITNCHNDRGKPLANARAEFVRLRLDLPSAGAVRIVGTGMEPKEAGRLTELERWLRRKPLMDDARRVARILGHEVQRIAHSYGENSRVGRGLMIACLPRQYVLGGGTTPSMGPPDGHALSVLHVPAEGERQLRTYPAFVRRGFKGIIYGMQVDIPAPADGSDPYSEWRGTLPLTSPRRQAPRSLP